jgi:hypothetical protein
MSTVLFDKDAGRFLDPRASNRWTLSEDPNDRKDGLWIWGLFKVVERRAFGEEGG